MEKSEEKSSPEINIRYSRGLPENDYHLYLRLMQGCFRTLPTVNLTTAEGSSSRDIVTSLGKKGRASFTGPGVPNIRIVNDPDLDPVVRELVTALKLPKEMSSLVLRLVIAFSSGTDALRHQSFD